MAGKSIQEGEYLDGYTNEALEARKAEIKLIEKIANDILEHKDKLDSLIVGIESEGMTYRSWVGSLNGCYGLTKRLRLQLESYMEDV